MEPIHAVVDSLTGSIVVPLGELIETNYRVTS